MKWYRHLFVGENAKKTKFKIMNKVNARKLQRDIYFITMPSNPNNMFDIINANIFLQPYFKKKENHKDIEIVGVAKGMDEAMEVVRVIVDKVYQETGDVKVKESLADAWR